MQRVEFDASIENGVIHIPKKYNFLQQKKIVNLRIDFDEKVEKNTNSIFDKFNINLDNFQFDRDKANAR
jgi:hypothetical protein